MSDALSYLSRHLIEAKVIDTLPANEPVMGEMPRPHLLLVRPPYDVPFLLFLNIPVSVVPV
jgi:hypothetical protein